MAVFYTSGKMADSEINQPQFQRTRHRYRGSRESYKFNLELCQMYFDIRRLYEDVQTARTNYTAQTASINAGGAVVAEVIVGLDDLTGRLQRLTDRVLALETS